jgi:hypothetical protein
MAISSISNFIYFTVNWYNKTIYETIKFKYLIRITHLDMHSHGYIIPFSTEKSVRKIKRQISKSTNILDINLFK